MIKLNINGKERTWDGDPDLPLLWFLRDEVCVSARGLDHDRQRGHITPIQRNQWSRGVTMMPMGGIFRSAFTLGRYGELAGPAIEAFGGRIVAKDVPAKAYEKGAKELSVLVAFDSIEAATGMYEK